MLPVFPDILVGGRLKHFLKEWYSITSDPEIIDMVQGMHIELADCPFQSRPPPEINHITTLIAK